MKYVYKIYCGQKFVGTQVAVSEKRACALMAMKKGLEYGTLKAEVRNEKVVNCSINVG